MIKILHVDDDRNDFELTEKQLLLISGELEIERAESVEKALEIYKKGRFDCILSDFQMPGMNGLQFLRNLRKRGDNTPFILLTGMGSEQIAADALREGADDYLTKEIGFSYHDHLMHSIRRLTDAHKQKARLKHVEKALRESEARYSSVVQTASEAIISIDSSWKIVSWNRGAEQTFGYEETEVLGKPISLLVPERLRETYVEFLEGHISRSKSEDVMKPVEFMGLKKDGSKFFQELSVSTLKTSAGTFYTVISRDIAERKTAEESLRDRASQMATIAQLGQRISAILELDELLHLAVKLISESFDYYNVVILLVDGNHIVLRAAMPAFLQTLEERIRLRVGYDGITGLVAASGEPLLVPDVTQDSRYYDALEVMETQSELAVPIKSDGRVIGVLDTQSAELDAFSRDDVSTLQTIADQLGVAINNARLYESAKKEIAERKKTEEALYKSEEQFKNMVELSLRESEEQFREMAGLLPTAICEIDTDLFPTYLNKAAFKLFDYSQDDVEAGFNMINSIHPDDRERAIKYIKEVMTGKKAGEEEHRMFRKDGSELTILLHSAPIYKSEKISGVRSTLTDITARKRAEEELRDSHKQLEKRTRELEEVNKELEAFSYTVSHDLRSPLLNMEGFSQLLLDNYGDNLDNKGKNYLQSLIAAGKRTTKLVEDLLRLSRFSCEILQIKPVDLSAIARKVAETLRGSEPERKVSLGIADGMVADADPLLLHVVLENLLGNAWKFTRNKKKVKIEFGTTEHEGKIAYFVKDNGIGFDAADADKLYKPFQRLHSHQQYEGSGIGLATVQRIIHRHGGRVWAEGQEEKGATFYFTLP